MTAVTFRRAVVADLPAIVRMLADDPLGSRRESADASLDPAYLAAFDAIAADPHQLLAVATLDDEVVGTMQLTFIPGLSRHGAWRGQVEAVRVSSAHRGAGIGEQMFAWAIDQCRARGCRLVQLTTDNDRTDAHRFYDRLGFVASHTGYKLTL
jgi:GNAT superfamily N-acetyltransferase